MSIKTQEMATEMYQRMCDYVGANHEGRSVEFIKFTLDSMEAEIDRLAKERDRLLVLATNHCDKSEIIMAINNVGLSADDNAAVINAIKEVGE